MKLGTTIVAACLLLGCPSDRPREHCRLGDEQTIFRSSSPISALTLSARENLLLAAWSNREGVWLSTLDTRGAPRVRPVRVKTERAQALDAVKTSTGWRMAMLVPGDLYSGGGGAFVMDVDTSGRLQSARKVGPAGPYSKQIALSQDLVAWHDGGPGTFLVRAYREPHLIEVGRGAFAALSPSVLTHPDGTHSLAWVELAGASGQNAAAIRLQEFATNLVPKGPPRTVARTAIDAAEPRLGQRGSRLLVLFRDKRRDERRISSYVVFPNDKSLRAHRIARANGPSGPDLEFCNGAWAIAAVRSYRLDHLVAFNRFDGAAVRLGGELQIYSDRVEFGAVSLDCIPSGHGLLYLERGADQSQVLYNTVDCEPAGTR